MNAVSGNWSVIIGLVIVAIGAYLYLRRRKANAAVTASTADILKAHLQAVNASVATSAAENRTHVNEMGKFLVAEVRKVAALVAPAPAPAPVGAALAQVLAEQARAPAPAAPALSAASVPPPSEVAPAAPVASGPDVYPKLTEIDGVQFRLDAPLNPAYRPSMAARIFGKPPAFVGDPSNGARYGQPTRSAAGYPLVYAVGGDGKVIGTASVAQGEQTFNSDAEVAAYNAATTPTAAQQVEAAAGWARVDAALKAQTAQSAPPERTALAASYPSVAALTADIAALHFTGAVTVDGRVLNPGFGKADGSAWAYTTQPDGSVKAA